MDAPPPEYSVPEEFNQRYSREERIGSGAFSVVYKYRIRHTSPATFVAVKIVDRASLRSRHPRLLSYLQSEIRALSELQAANSPSIIRLHGIYTLTTKTLLVFDYCDLDFRNYLLHQWQKKRQHLQRVGVGVGVGVAVDGTGSSDSSSDSSCCRLPSMSELEITYWLRSLRSGLTVLRQYGWLHRDLKPENFLLKKKDSWKKPRVQQRQSQQQRHVPPVWERFELKLSDFGFAKQMIGLRDLTSSTCGTPNYFSPEMVEKVPYDYRIDLWCIGVIAVEMIIGRTLFRANRSKRGLRRRRMERAQKLRRLKKMIQAFDVEDVCSSYELSPEMQDLLRGLLVEQDRRIDFEAFSNHPVFSKDADRVFALGVKEIEIQRRRKILQEGGTPSPVESEGENSSEESSLPPVLVIHESEGEDGFVVKPISDDEDDFAQDSLVVPSQGQGSGMHDSSSDSDDGPVVEPYDEMDPEAIDSILDLPMALSTGDFVTALRMRLRTGTIIFQLRDRLQFKASERSCRIPLPLDEGEYIFRAVNHDEPILTVMNKFWCKLNVCREDGQENGDSLKVLPGLLNYRKDGDFTCVGPTPIYFTIVVGQGVSALVDIVLRPKRRGFVGKRVKLVWSKHGHLVEFELLLSKTRTRMIH